MRSRHHFSPSVRTSLLIVALAAFLASPHWWPSQGTALAEEDQTILNVAKSTVYGALTGLLLGGVTALVVDKGDRDDAIRWGIVIGSFAGFGYGVYNAATSTGDEDFFVEPQLSWEPDAEVRLLIRERFPTAFKIGSPQDPDPSPTRLLAGRAQDPFFHGPRFHLHPVDPAAPLGR